MMKFWANLGQRQRLLVSAGGGALFIIIIVSMWLSFTGDVSRLKESVAEQRGLDHWMKSVAAEAQRARSTGNRPTDGRSLLAIVDQTARQGRLGSALKRVEPDGNDKVRIRLEQASFDDVAMWLEQLEQRNQIVVDNITIDKQDHSGIVDARVSLQGSNL